MPRVCILVFCLCLVVARSFVPLHAQAGTQPPPAFNPVNTKLVIPVPGPDKVTVRENITFKSIAETQLFMDVYAPPDGKAHPAVVLVSGASNVRAWGLYKEYGRLIGGSGLIAVIPDKRYEGQPSLETGAQDTLDLLAHLRQNATTYNIDPKRVCLWTFSAGGSLAQVGIAPENNLTCVIAYYGLGQAGPRLALRQHVDKMPPMLVVRAGRDGAPGNNAIDVFVTSALALNAPITFLNYPAGLHAFEVEDTRPEPKDPANIAQTERILRVTLDWIKAQTK